MGWNGGPNYWDNIFLKWNESQRPSNLNPIVYLMNGLWDSFRLNGDMYILPSNQHVFLVILPLYSVLTVFGDVSGVLLMSWWWWRCSRMVSSWYWRNGIFWLSCLTCQCQIGVKGMKREALLLGLYAGLILIDRPNILAGEMFFWPVKSTFGLLKLPKRLAKSFFWMVTSVKSPMNCVNFPCSPHPHDHDVDVSISDK